MAAIPGLIPAEVTRSTEWQARMRLSGRASNALLRKVPIPIFEGARKAVALVDVTRAWASKPMRITSVSKAKAPKEFNLGERTEGRIACYETVAAACRAPQQPGAKLPRNTTRQLLLLEVGIIGNGTSGVVRGANGVLICNTVRAVSLAPLPDGALGAKAMPLPPFWLPSGGKEDWPLGTLPSAPDMPAAGLPPAPAGKLLPSAIAALVAGVPASAPAPAPAPAANDPNYAVAAEVVTSAVADAFTDVGLD